MGRENTVKYKSFEFAKRVVKLYKYLCDEKKEFILSKQLLRSGSSIGANITEADVAYRVNPKKATRFRQWATKRCTRYPKRLCMVW